MILGLLASAVAASTVELFTGGAFLGIAVYTASRTGKAYKRRK